MSHVWFITGTSSGLGKAMAEQVLMHDDTRVYGIGRRHTIVHENYLPINIDLSDLAVLKQFVFPSLEAQTIVLFNNAGRLGEIAYCGNLDNEDIIQSYTVNTIAPHLFCNQFIAQYQAADAQKIIINITSGAAKTVYDGWGVYGAGKAALDMFTQSIAAEQQKINATNKILAYAIAPGVMQTAMQDQIRNTEAVNFSQQQKFKDLYQNNKLYHPEDVARWFWHFVQSCDSQQETVQRINL